jgi:hypothetical protein
MTAFLTTLYSELLPVLLQLIGALLGLLLMRAAAVAKTRWGIEIEARHREALHSALMSGITAALMNGLRGKDAVDAAISHAARSVPDALAALEPSTEVLTSLASAKLRDARPLVEYYVDTPVKIQVPE